VSGAAFCATLLPRIPPERNVPITMLRHTILPLALLALLSLGSCYDNPTVIPDKTPAQAWTETAFETYSKEKVLPGDELPTVMSIDLYERGTGKEVLKGDQVSVHYTGWVKNTEVIFDSSHNRPSPISFKLGAGRVIAGWELGIEGMQVGTRARLHIPSGLGWGTRGADAAIPPNSDVVFDVEVVATK